MYVQDILLNPHMYIAAVETQLFAKCAYIGMPTYTGRLCRELLLLAAILSSAHEQFPEQDW